MSQSADAVEQIIRLSTQAGEIALRLSGEGAKLLIDLISKNLVGDNGSNPKIHSGKTRLRKLLQACRAEGGSRIDNWSMTKAQYIKFKKRAGKYKLEYAAVHDRANDTYTVLAREVDFSRLDLIFRETGIDINNLQKGDSAHIEEIDPKDLEHDTPDMSQEESEVKKKTVSGKQSHGPDYGSTEQPPPTDKTPKIIDTPFTRRGSIADLSEVEIVDVEYMQIPRITAREKSLALPTPEGYILPNAPPPGTIHSPPPAGSKIDTKSIRYRVNSIKAGMKAKTPKIKAPEKAR